VTGAHDWSAGILACNVVASAASTFNSLERNGFFELRTHAGCDACAPVRVLSTVKRNLACDDGQLNVAVGI